MLDLTKAHRVEVRRSQGKTKQAYKIYYFKCSVCSDEINAMHSQAKNHSGKCLSCSHKKRKYQSAYTNLLGNTRRGIEVKLTYEEFLILAFVKECHYCGVEIKRSLKRGDLGYRGYFIDRVDNSKGYLPDNCVPCCWPCNQAKGNRYTYDEFRTISAAILSMRNRRKPDYSDHRDHFLILNGWMDD